MPASVNDFSLTRSTGILQALSNNSSADSINTAFTYL